VTSLTRKGLLHSRTGHTEQIEEWPASQIEKCTFPKEMVVIIIGKDQKDTVVNFMRSFPSDRSKASNVTSDAELHTNIEKFTKEYKTIMQELNQNLMITVVQT